MAVKPPFSFTQKINNCIVHTTIINFDDEKHPDIFNRTLAEFIVDKVNRELNDEVVNR